MSLPVGLLVEAEGLFAVRSVGNDRVGAAGLELLAQFSAVVGFVAEKLEGGFGPAKQPRRRRTIMGLAAAQEDGKKTAFSICDCVDFRIAPAARASNRLVLFPLFAPAAERCALM